MLAGVCGAMTGTVPAVAQSPSEIAAAAQWFEEGLAHEEQGRWNEALQSFRRAAQVKQTAQILFHQGLCEKHVGLLVEAALSLSRSAAMAWRDNLDKVERAANTELDDVRLRTPSIQVVLPDGRQADKVMLDGKELSQVFLTQPIPVNPGSHEVVVVSGSAEMRETVVVAERDRSTVRFQTSRTEAPSEAPPVEEPVSTPQVAPVGDTPPDAGSPAETNTLAWVLTGSGLLALGGGALFWMKRNDQLSRIDDICPTRDSCPAGREDEVQDLESKGTTYSGLGLGLFGVGAVTTAIGVVILFGTEDEAPVTVGAHWLPGQTGASIGGSF